MPAPCPTMSELRFTDVFTVCRREKVGGGSKTAPADRFYWIGNVDGVWVSLRSTVRLVNPLIYFLTPSAARIHFVRDLGPHFIDIEVLRPSAAAPDLLARIAAMAAAEDGREVRIRRAGERLRPSVK